MTRTVRDITSAIASGDTETFALFYQRWFDFTYAQARRTTGRDEQFCLDVVQDSMLRVIRSILPMDTELDVQRWMGVVVKSCAYDQLRRESRRRRREDSRSRREGGSGHDPCDAERLNWLRQELSNLDAGQAHVLTMRFRLGWTLQRIGAALGLTPGAVDGRISRSLAALRRRAQEEFHE